MTLLPQLLPKGAPPPPSSALAQLAQLPQFAEPPTQSIKLGLNLLPAEAIPEPAPAVVAAPTTASLGVATIGSAVALALGIVLATPEATANEDAVLERLRREDDLLQNPAEAPQLVETLIYPFTGGQGDGVIYNVTYACNRTDGLKITFGTGQTGAQFAYGPITKIRAAQFQNTTEADFFVTCQGTNETGYVGFLREIRVNRLNGPFKYETFKIVSVTRRDGRADTSGDPPPLNQPISSALGKTLSSLEPYKREISDRPIPTSAPQLQLAPIFAPISTPLPEFAEPEPKLQILPSILPALFANPNFSTDTAPEVANEPKKAPAPTPNLKKTPTTTPTPTSVKIYVPSSAPESIKTVQDFAPNPTTRAPEPKPIDLTKPKIDPKPELTSLEKIQQQTSPEALKKAAVDATCQTLKSDGCMNPLAKNAEVAANNSANNSSKLDQLNAGLNTAQLANTNFWLPILVPTVSCELGADEKYAPTRSFTTVKIQANATGSEAEQVQAQFEEIAKASESACLARNNEVYIAQPETWSLKAGNDIPQLAVIFREDLGNGKLGRSTYSLYVPHYYSNSPPQKSPLPAYYKGSHQGNYTCKDNSNFFVYAKSEEQAEIMVNAAKAVIKPAMLSTTPNKFGKIKGKVFKEAKMVPVRAQYFSKGKEQVYPDWTAYFHK